ncbi:glycoside hydrolase family 43 protein [Cohnella sp. GCM10027633]|uniref:glycoside hydrolase family 43 protein n=1 Tax=unclassified Cohnella TaxID=2636738 RepID=UPI00363B93BA
MSEMTYLRTLSDRTYANPLPVDYEADDEAGNDVPRTHPDPYVLSFKGEYYCYSTAHRGVTVLHSRDLARWTSRGHALLSSEKSYWAPCVFYHNGLFYMYYSSGDTAEHFQWLKVAVSDSPLGPFEYRRTLFDFFSIDAHVVKDDDGALYLFYSVDNYAGTDPNRPGTVILMDRLLDPLTPEGKPRLVVSATLDEEISGPDRFGDGRDWHTLEGGFYLKRDGRHYLMYSGNSFERDDYFVGTATDAAAKTIGECAFAKVPNARTYAPLLRKNGKVEGTGHHSVAIAPNLVDHWVMYHGRDVRDEASSEERRELRMDPLHWAGDRMWIPGPTWLRQDAPGMPAFRELGDGPEGAPDPVLWDVEAGDWRVQDGELTSVSAQGAGLIRMRREWTDFRFEAWQRCLPEMTGCVCGVWLEGLRDSFGDAPSSVRIVVDAGRKELVVIGIQGHLEAELARIGLPSGFDPYAWHRIGVDKFGSALTVSLDGSKLFEHAIIAFDACTLGLATLRSRAAFGGIAVSAHYETRFRGLAELNGRFEATGAIVVGPEGADIRARKDGETSLGYRTACPETYTAQWDFELLLQAAGGKAGLRWEHADGGATGELLLEWDAGGEARLALRDANSGSELAKAALPPANLPRALSILVRRAPGGSEIRVNGMKLHEAGADSSPWLTGRMAVFAAGAELRLTGFRLTEGAV